MAKVKKKGIFAVFLIFLCLLGFLGTVQLFIQLTRSENGSLVVNEAYWLRLATNAWRYFQPGVALNPTTGLHGSALYFPFFTDWDLGVYIQTIIDANQLGILSNDGTWGADARFNKVLTFLETRPLTSNGVPYIWYESATGNQKWSGQQNAADTGELLVALNNLRTLRPNLASSINNIVYNRTNYEPLERAVDALTNSRNLYDYYVASSFASFWPDRFSALANSILNNIMSAPTVITYGVTLPISQLTCEPLLLSVFNLAPDAKLQDLAKQVYLAHEARYNATGKFAAFSEGNTPFDAPDYVYEWVVKEDGSTWVIEDTGQVRQAIVPMIYFKAAVGLQAMYDTAFTENMVSYVESCLPAPANGYADGIDENGRVDTNVIDKTNAMIIGAARYAINNISSSTPSPSPNPTSTISSPPVSPAPSPSPGSTSPNPSPSPYPSFSPPVSPNPSPSPDGSAGLSLANPLEGWLVASVIVLVMVLCFSLFALRIIRHRKKNSAVSAIRCTLQFKRFTIAYAIF